MKNNILIAMTAAFVLGSTMTQAADDIAPPSISLGSAVLDIAPDGSEPLSANELADTRGEAMLVWKKKCYWWKACTYLPTIKYIRVTSKSRSGNSYTYTRNH